MSSKDDPSGSGGKTLIRPVSARVTKPGPVRSTSQRPAPDEGSDATVFDPGIQSSAPDWSSGTVIYQGIPFAENAAPSETHPRSTYPSIPVTRKVAQEALFEQMVDYSSPNPLIAAAAPILMLLGHLRLMIAELEVVSLATHLGETIQEFERRMADAAVPAEDARIAKFVLCETVDDVAGNLPGFEKNVWKQHGMLSRFFQTAHPGAGFFKALNKVLADPEPHHDLLELMQVCLSLGFEGQYRGMAREDESLPRVRRDVYDTLRYFSPRPGEEISPRWQGLSAAMMQTSARIPLWSVAALALALVAGIFFALRVLITDEGDRLADQLLALNPTSPPIIERASFVPLTEEVEPVTTTQTTQIDRVRAALAQEIEAGGLTVDSKGEFIVVEINNGMLFASGKADVRDEFDPIAGRIATALESEPGPIKIVGHTDNEKPRKSSAFKSNFDLSVARAKAVEKVMATKIRDPSRLAVEGKGEDEPIADNETQEGRARNRRVDLMIQREETL